MHGGDEIRDEAAQERRWGLTRSTVLASALAGACRRVFVTIGISLQKQRANRANDVILRTLLCIFAVSPLISVRALASDEGYWISDSSGCKVVPCQMQYPLVVILKSEF
jgi:hypothetical protein